MKNAGLKQNVVSRSLVGSAALVAWVLVLGLGFLGGCAGKNPHPKGSYDRALFFADNHKNIEAVAALDSYIRFNPTDSLAAEAQYLKSMVYMDMEEYPLAAVEFQILRKDYPTCNKIEDSYFQEGVSYFRQVGDVQRDVTGAHEARLHFLKFSQEFPTSTYMPQVIEIMQEISDMMVAKRLNQAKVFRQLGRWEAVETTLGITLEEEGASTLLDQVLWERGKAAQRLWDLDTAKEMFERLVNEFPDSKYAKKARGALEKLAADPVLENEDT